MKRKLIAPIVISVLLCAYYIGLGVLFMHIPELPGWVRGVAIVVPLIFCGVMVSVLVQRIREIRSGEEDDLDQY